jgi:S-adenosylmethionine-diacylglycerol 3-amino-3-carboxypropyl transferase
MTSDVSPWVDEAARLPVAFAQVREDAVLDAELVSSLRAGAHIIMVASGGCTAAFLATLPNVARLHLVDPNPAQLALAWLKLHLLQTTPPEQRLALLGHTAMSSDERADRLIPALQSLHLDPTVLGPLGTWAALGPDQAGRYEVLFAQLRQALSDREAELADLLRLRGPAEQARRIAPDTDLGHALDEAFDGVMALPNLVRLFGEEATRNRYEPFSRHFARRTRHALATLPAADNPYLGQVLRGRFADGVVSPWLAAPAPPRIPPVTWSCSLMTDALRAAPGEFEFVHLSNILDWLSPENARATLELAWSALRPGGWVFIRQLNSTLDIPSLGERFDWHGEQAADLHARDRSYFYRALHLGRKR